jgi:Uma2 family endonuclease
MYRTYPDIFVYARRIDPKRGSVSLDTDGPPVLIVEVLSDATYEADIDLVRGKGYSYARAGIQEYLALDPTRELLPEGIRAWRLGDAAYRSWEPDAGGRWQSSQIPIAISLDGAQANVYTRDGRRMLHEGEIELELARLRGLLAERDAKDG